jgi:hypothetical protein
MGFFGMFDSHEVNTTTTPYTDSFNTFTSTNVGYSDVGNISIKLGGVGPDSGGDGNQAPGPAGGFTSKIPSWIGPAALVGALGVLALLEFRKR